MRRARLLEPLWSALLALAAVGAALVSQHHFDMQPCPWCVLQRLLFVMVALVALIELAALVLRSRNPLQDALDGQRRGVGVKRHPQASVALPMLAGLRSWVAACGLAAALWQHVVAASSASCNLTLADRLMAFTGLDGLLPEIFQPRASCLEAKAWLLGVPYELWSGVLFAALAVMALWSLKTTMRSPSGRSAAPAIDRP